MELFERVKALGRAGRPHEGIALVERAAAIGDPEACVILAHWHLYGTDRPRNTGAAYGLLEHAHHKGNPLATRILANLTANGTGCQADPRKALEVLRSIAGVDPAAEAQLAVLERAMTLQEKNSDREQLSIDPHIEIVRKLLLPDECEYLMRIAEPSLKPSFIFDAATGAGKPDPIRTSDGASFLPHDEDLVVQAINRRIAVATGTHVRDAEALYVMRYLQGQEYKPHLDALPGLQQQRAWTAIAYLNDDYGGGATEFTELSISVRGQAGDLLIFRNIHENGRADARVRHTGRPVTAGVKWIGTRWIRQGHHDPYGLG